MNSMWQDAFRKYLAPTSPEPIGISVERAEGPYLYSPDGKRYIDFLSGIGVANIGHTHPRVVEAVEVQNRRHHHVMVYGEYIQEAPALYAQELCAKLPSNLQQIYFVNSGAEAVEGALKLARKATGRQAFGAFIGAYHGDTLGALSVAGNRIFQEPYEPLLGPVEMMRFGDASSLTAIDERLAAVILEPIQGEGGVRIPSREFMESLFLRCRETGTLVIFDEVLTGFGRTGNLYAWEHWGIAPDILVHAKALGGGLPLGMFVASEKLLHEFVDPPLGHITTFGGHPLSCAAGRAALSVIEDERLVERSAKVGETFLAQISQTLGEFDCVRETRGLGMLFGIELDSAQLTSQFVAGCRDRGLLLGWTLHHDHVLRISPPLNTPEDTLGEGLETMVQVLESLSQRA